MARVADESLLYLRHWPNGDNYCDLNLLFLNGNPKRGNIAGTRIELTWEYLQEFVSTAYSEPLECVHARRDAFGGSSIRILSSSSKLDVPCRRLLSNKTEFATYQKGFVRLRWLLASVFEVPKFCIASALSEKGRVDWGFEPRRIEMLRAAMQIKPTRFDVIGFTTIDGDLLGAVEFVEMKDESLCVAHIVAVSRNDRKLRAGDELLSCFIGHIGDTSIFAERHVLDVLDVGEADVPELVNPTSI